MVETSGNGFPGQGRVSNDCAGANRQTILLLGAREGSGALRPLGLAWGAAVGIVLAVLVWLRVATPLSQVPYDLLAATLGGVDPDPRIALVAIDQASLDQLGAFPWSRDIHARLVDRLSGAGAKAIVFDLAFTDPTPHDAALAGALQRARSTFLPVLWNSREAAPIAVYDPPAPELRAAATGLGHISLPIESDGVVRRVAVEHAAEDEGFLALGLVSTLAEVGVNPVELQAPQDGRYTIGSLTIPVNQRLETPIAFAGAPGQYPAFSYAAVLRGEVPAAVFRQRIVLVGATATGLGDQHATPLSRIGGEPMSGLEIQANIVNMVLKREFRTIFEPAWWPVALALLLTAWGLWQARQAVSTRSIALIGALIVPIEVIEVAGCVCLGGGSRCHTDYWKAFSWATIWLGGNSALQSDRQLLH